MESLEQQLKNVTLKNKEHPKVAELIENLSHNQNEYPLKKIAPSIPPKPPKKRTMPQVPSSRQVRSREPLYSQPLLGIDKSCAHVLPQKYSNYCGEQSCNPHNNKTTLDNPAILEQQLEALAYRKLQMEKKGLLGTQIIESDSKLSSNCLTNNSIYSNAKSISSSVHANTCTKPKNVSLHLYSNVQHLDSNPPILSICTNLLSTDDIHEDLPPPTSPVSAVSSSYSELRRATNVFSKHKDSTDIPTNNYTNQYEGQKEAVTKIHQEKATQNYYGYAGQSQTSSTYDSIYEPINPRPSGDILPRDSCNLYGSYVNSYIRPCDLNLSNAVDESRLTSSSSSLIWEAAGKEHKPGLNIDNKDRHSYKNNRIGLQNYNLHVTDGSNDLENYGICVKCNSRVLGENSGCTAMNQIYHTLCFTCTECQINLQGKPFYALDGKPYCEYDYLQTLEKCSVCMEPILERILRATGKPYHPQCFTCIVCGKSLDGLLFTVDATNQNYCISDFHKKFAPRCCVCKHPIMPDSGQEETVRVVALDRSFHLECYKCEDCGLLLSSEAEGRGCYPLDDHVLCKSCNAERVQVLTNRMTCESSTA